MESNAPSGRGLQGSLSSENAWSGEATAHLKTEVWDSKQEQTLSLANPEDLCPRMTCITHIAYKAQ